MKCLICKNGETEIGKTDVTFTREDFVVVFRNVPAQICGNCGEEYTDDAVAKELFKVAEEAFSKGVKVDVRDFKAA